MNRCFGSIKDQEIYAKYHDEEWGVPVHNDRVLFEFLILEGAQAGLTWLTILKRRAGYQKAFKNFDPKKVSQMTDDELEELRSNKEIIRNKLKIYSARNNAKLFLEIQKEFGSFDKFLWQFVDNAPIINEFYSMEEVPTQTEISEKISKALKKRGMKFVGPTIMYAYMQAVGMVNDHLLTCWKRK